MQESGDEPRRRAHWLSGEWLREQLTTRQADAELRHQLDEVVGSRIEVP
jgi:hypothetical protein